MQRWCGGRGDGGGGGGGGTRAAAHEEAAAKITELHAALRAAQQEVTRATERREAAEYTAAAAEHRAIDLTNELDEKRTFHRTSLDPDNSGYSVSKSTLSCDIAMCSVVVVMCVRVDGSGKLVLDQQAEVHELRSAASECVAQLTEGSTALHAQTNRANQLETNLQAQAQALAVARTELHDARAELNKRRHSSGSSVVRHTGHLQSPRLSLRRTAAETGVRKDDSSRLRTPDRQRRAGAVTAGSPLLGPVLRQVRRELLATAADGMAATTRESARAAMSSIDKANDGWLAPKKFAFGLGLLGISLPAASLDALVRELSQRRPESPGGGSPRTGKFDRGVRIERFLRRVFDSGPPTPSTIHSTSATDAAWFQDNTASSPTAAPSPMRRGGSADELTAQVIRQLSEYTSASKTTVKGLLSRYNAKPRGSSSLGADELPTAAFASGLRQAGCAGLSTLDVQKVMEKLILLSGSARPTSTLPTRVAIGQVLAGMKQWRRHHVLGVGVSSTADEPSVTRPAPSSGAGSSRSVRKGAAMMMMSHDAQEEAAQDPAREGSSGSSAAVNASGALFVQLEELSSEATQQAAAARQAQARQLAAEKEVTRLQARVRVLESCATEAKQRARVGQAIDSATPPHQNPAAGAKKSQSKSPARSTKAVPAATNLEAHHEAGQHAAQMVSQAQQEHRTEQAEWAREMAALRGLNDELDKEAARLRSLLDDAGTQQAQLQAEHAAQLARSSADHKHQLAQEAKRQRRIAHEGAEAEIQQVMAARDAADVEAASAIATVQAELRAARQAERDARASVVALQTGKSQMALASAEKELSDLRESEAGLKKLLEARQRGLSTTVQSRHELQVQVDAAVAQLAQGKTGTRRPPAGSGAAATGTGAVAARDSWLGAGRALAVGDRVALAADTGVRA
jgi:hypothetical protein